MLIIFVLMNVFRSSGSLMAFKTKKTTEKIADQKH